MTIIGLILAALKFINVLMDTVGREKLRQSGRDEEIARQLEAIHRKTEAGKRIWEKVDALSDAEVDAGLRDLEPK